MAERKIMNNIIFLTDFGISDPYIGVMKGIIKSINPIAEFIDLTNNVLPQNIIQAQYILETSYRYFPKNSIFLAVIDPTVGSDRKIILVETEDYKFLAPDNGLLTPIIKNEKCCITSIQNNKYFLDNISNTFHGRDIFAPASAYLSKGISSKLMGENLTKDSVVYLDFKPQYANNIIHGNIIHIDKFGNCISNISKNEKILRSSIQIKIADLILNKIHNTYADVKLNTCLAYWGSTDRIELSINSGNFAQYYNISINQEVILGNE